MSIPSPLLDKINLSDGSDDFDFVTDDTPENDFPSTDVYTFEALDGTQRTDTWLSNREELAAGTDPVDPDTDNDGLTDGQEINRITIVSTSGTVNPNAQPSISIDSKVPSASNASDPDSDGDGYWDGWIGVYGVDRTDNVVLYREHLHDDDDGDGETTDDGVQGDERVDSQVGIHPANVDHMTASATSATYGGQQYHSNLHIGELTFGTDPTANKSSETTSRATPDPSRVYEVDTYAGAEQKLRNPAWLRAVENNFRLYGIDVSMKMDEVLTDDDLTSPKYCDSQPFRDCSIPDDGFATTEIAVLAGDYANEPSDEYVFVADKPVDSLFLNETTQWGINPKVGSQIGVFSTNLNNNTGRVPSRSVSASGYESKLGLLTGALLMHEIGHSYDIGRADDRSWEVPTRNGEIYSGMTGDHPDYSPETMANKNNNIIEWSLMRRGWTSDNVFYRNQRAYQVFSIEELSSTNP